MKNIVLRLALLTGALAASGCGSFRPYDKAADTLATEVKTGYTEVKIVDAIRVEQTDLDMLDKKEQEALLKLVAARRDQQLMALVSNGRDFFVPRLTGMIDQRLTELVSPVKNDADVERINNALGNVSAAQSKLIGRSTRESAQRIQLSQQLPQFAKLPPCVPQNEALYTDATLAGLRKALKIPDLDVGADQLRAYAQYVQYACKPMIEAQQAIKTQLQRLDGGLLATTIKEADKFEKDQKEKQQQAVDAKKALTDSIADVKSAQQAGAAVADARDLTCKEPPSEGAKTQKICDALANLDKLGDVGKKIVAEEKIKQINVLLAALSGSADNGEDKLSPALAFLNTSQRFAFALQDYANANKLPALEPLLIEKQLAQSRLNYATRTTELDKTRVGLAHEKADALQLELDLLLQARAVLGELPAPAKGGCPAASAAPYCSSLGILLSKENKSTSGRVAYRALGFYTESYTVAQTRYETADLKLAVLGYREALIRSEASIGYWDALIATPLTQLQTYYASGVKASEIAELLQAVSIFWIAVK